MAKAIMERKKSIVEELNENKWTKSTSQKTTAQSKSSSSSNKSSSSSSSSGSAREMDKKGFNQNSSSSSKSSSSSSSKKSSSSSSSKKSSSSSSSKSSSSSSSKSSSSSSSKKSSTSGSSKSSTSGSSKKSTSGSSEKKSGTQKSFYEDYLERKEEQEKSTDLFGGLVKSPFKAAEKFTPYSQRKQSEKKYTQTAPGTKANSFISGTKSSTAKVSGSTGAKKNAMTSRAADTTAGGFYRDYQKRREEQSINPITRITQQASAKAEQTGSGSLFSTTASGAARKRFVPSTVAGRTKAKEMYPNTQLVNPNKVTSIKNPTKLQMYGNDFTTGLNNVWSGMLQTADDFRMNAPIKILTQAAKSKAGGNKYLNTALDILGNMTDPIATAVDTLRGIYDRATAAGQVRAQQYHYQTPGNLDDYIGMGVSATASAIPQAALAMATAGTSQATQLANMSAGAAEQAITRLVNNPQFWLSFAQTAGPEYEKAKQSGANEITARAAAFNTGIANALIEIGGGIETFQPTATGIARNIATSAFEEGREEVLQGAVSNLIAKGAYDPTRPFYSTTDENAVINPNRMAQEFAGGALAAGVMGGARTGLDMAYAPYANAVAAGERIRRNGDVENVYDEGLRQGTGTEAYRQARRFTPNTASDYRVGRQAELNARAMADEARMARLVNERTGYNVNYRDDMPNYAAGTNSDGNIDINANKGQRVDTVMHEIGHIDSPEAEAAAEKTIEILKKPENVEQFEARKNVLRDTYDRQGIPYTDELLEREIATDMKRGMYRTATEYDKVTSTDNYGRDRFVPNTVRRVTSNVKSAFGGMVTNENTGITISAKDANTIREAWERADNAAAGAYRAGNTSSVSYADSFPSRGSLDGETKYSIVQKPEGDYKVIADRDIFAGVAPEQRNGVLKDFINNNLRGNQYISLTDGATLNVAQKNKTVQKLYRPGISMNSGKYAARQETAAHYDEALEASKKTGTESAKNDKHNNTDVDKRTVEIEVPHFDENDKLIDGEVWKAEISVMNDSDTAYDISKLVNITKDTHSDLREMLKANPNIDRVSLSDMVSQSDNFVKRNEIKTNPNGNVNTNFSVDTSEQTRTDIDNEYLNAVNRGDTETARRLVREQAERNGYSTDTDWRMDHHAPTREDDIPAYDLRGVYGEEIYSPMAARYYGTGAPFDQKAVNIIQSMKDNPEKIVSVYRAVPTSVKDTRLRNGDWVTITEDYAEEHGWRVLDENYRIIKNEVPAKYLFSDGNSIHEFGYDNGQAEAYRNTENNAKSLDTVTYDDNGNIIPLSQRFNARNSDTRYSVDTNAENTETPSTPSEEDWDNLMTGSEAENQARRQSAEETREAEKRTRIVMEQQGVTSPRELAPDTVTRRQSENERSLWKSPSPVRKAMSKTYTAVVDDMHPFWNYNKAYERKSSTTTYGKDNPYKLAINAKDAASRASYIVTDEMVDFDNNTVGNGLINTITDSGITQHSYDDFNKYLVARHALEWLDPNGHGAVKNVYENPLLNDMGVVQSMVDDFENAHPEFKQAADNLYEWQRKLMKTWLVDTGVITQEQYDTFTQMYPDYVPFFREQDTTLGRGKVGMANGGSVIKEAVGTESRRILEPIENIMYNVASYVNHATKHEVIKTAVQQYDMLDSDPENNVLRQYWEEVVPVNPEQEQNLYFRPKRGDDPSVDDATNEGERSISSTLRQQSDVRDGIVSFLDDGKMRYFRVLDKDFLNVLDNVRKGRDGVLAILAAFSRTRAALITSNNPAFALASNPIRDFGTLITNSTDANKAKIAARAVASYFDIAKGSDAYQSYLSMGGQYSSVNTEGMTAMKQALQKLQGKDPNLVKRFFKLFPKGFGVYQTVSDAIESAPRMAEFKSALKKGYDYHEAFYRAKDVTTNFSRGGQIAKELNAVSNFFNASIQGVDKYFRQAKNNPKSFAIGIACLTVPELLAWAWNHYDDDDDKEKKEAYDNLSNYHKNNSYNFYIGDGKFVSILKARESAAITSAIGMALDKFLAGESDRDKDFFADYLLSQFLPDGSIIGLSTLNDLRANKDYMDKPIVSDALSDLPNELQYDDNTSYLAKWLGGVLKVSPKQIDYVINSETGVLGKVNKTYFTPSAKNDKAAMFSFGVSNTYVKDSLFSTDNLNMFYDNKEEAEKQVNGYPNAENQYLSKRYAQSGNVLTLLNKLYKAQSADGDTETARETRRAYVNYARENKDNPMGLSAEVYNELKGLYDVDSSLLTMPSIATSGEITAKVDGQKKGFVFETADNVLNYQSDLNKHVDEAYWNLINSDEYKAMDDIDKAGALEKAQKAAVNEVKAFYVQNQGAERMYDEGIPNSEEKPKGNLFSNLLNHGKEKPNQTPEPSPTAEESAVPDGATPSPTAAPSENSSAPEPTKRPVPTPNPNAERDNRVNSNIQTIADNLAKAVPEKAKEYSADKLKINRIDSVPDSVEKEAVAAANEEYYSNLDKLMSGEANIEDVLGYKSNGKPRTKEALGGGSVEMTGKLYDENGNPRFDDYVMGKILYDIKENATDNAKLKYQGEITGKSGGLPFETSADAAEVTPQQAAAAIGFDGSYDKDQLGDLDVKTELPKLTEEQISAIIKKHFSESDVISASDANGIYKAQEETGMSALALLGIGALESGWGKSPIGNNIWGYGATNDNPSGNAHKYSQISEGALEYAKEFMKTYYDDYGAKSINSAGTGDNPSGKGYAYTDNKEIDSSWAGKVKQIMGQIYDTAKEALTGTSASAAEPSDKEVGNAIAATAKQYVGTPYVWGGESEDGWDCSGYVINMFDKFGINIPERTTEEQWASGTGERITNQEDLQPGDCLYFEDSSGDVHHVAIYMGDGMMVHAKGSAYGTVVESFADSDYYQSQFIGAKRYYTAGNSTAVSSGSSSGKKFRASSSRSSGSSSSSRSSGSSSSSSSSGTTRFRARETASASGAPFDYDSYDDFLDSVEAEYGIRPSGRTHKTSAGSSARAASAPVSTSLSAITGLGGVTGFKGSSALPSRGKLTGTQLRRAAAAGLFRNLMPWGRT